MSEMAGDTEPAAAGSEANASSAVMITIIVVSFYGMTDEVHQAFVPFRESSWPDWLADTLGGVIGAVGFRRFAEGDARAGLP